MGLDGKTIDLGMLYSRRPVAENVLQPCALIYFCNLIDSHTVRCIL